jgi:Uma2 family endonuclease
MNEIIRSLAPLYRKPGATQAGDGYPRRKWTSEEVQRMLEAGILHEDDHVELIGGELIVMSAKGNFHEDLKAVLSTLWQKNSPPEIRVVQETPLHLSDSDEPEPEFILFPSSIRRRDVRGDTALLVVEVADPSLKYDKMLKARLYASFGVREYWVIDAVKLETTVHLEPQGTSYGSVKTYKPRKLLTPHLAPALAVRLADLKIDEA